MIETIRLQNFAAFAELEMNLGSRINVIIGENSCGKTQLLKAGYALAKQSGYLANQGASESKEVKRAHASEILLQLYKPKDNRLGSLRHQGATRPASVSCLFGNGDNIEVSFGARSKNVKIESAAVSDSSVGATLIPTKEVLSFVDGFTAEDSDETTLRRLFDSSYFDLIKKISSSPLEQVESKALWLYEKVTNEIEGRFTWAGQQVSFQPGVYRDVSRKGSSAIVTEFKPGRRSSVESVMTAEGYRKVGVLQQLLLTGNLGNGDDITLFWDEPEANMNPILMRLLVEVLLEISRKGQQVVLATHDYMLLKWLDLLSDANNDDHVKYHVLHRESFYDPIQLRSTENYFDIYPNAIGKAFDELTDSQLARQIEGIGN